jgi:hypothetical protein
MKAKHTKGPWAVENVNSDALHDVIMDYQIPGAGFPCLVATVFADDDPHRPGDISNAEAEANARLIAAAPDMLAALEDVATACEGTAIVPVSTILPAVLAALKKANQ